MILDLPWPPSGNRYWRRAQGRVLISREGRSYRRQVAAVVLAQRVTAFDPGWRLNVEIQAFPPDRRRRDLDNLFKVPLDALEKGGVIPDDEAIDELRIRRLAVTKGGLIRVRLEPMETGEEAV